MKYVLSHEDINKIRNVASKIKVEEPYDALYLLNLLKKIRPKGLIINSEINKTKNIIKEKNAIGKKQIQSFIDTPVTNLKHNRKIWMYWRQGVVEAPTIVKQSISTWEKQNPDYEVIVLTEKSLALYLGFDIDSIFDNCSVNLGDAGKSDLIRLLILYKYGGVWADATTFCMNSLSNWLDVEQDIFFFRQKDLDSDRYLVSWFLFAKEGTTFFKEWIQLISNYLFSYRECKLNLTQDLKVSGLDKNEYRFKDSGYNLLKAMEGKNLCPYFWLFYLFNEALKCYPAIDGNVSKQSNNYVQHNDSLSDFIKCDVAKQTYKNKYMDSIQYKERVEYLEIQK